MPLPPLATQRQRADLVARGGSQTGFGLRAASCPDDSAGPSVPPQLGLGGCDPRTVEGRVDHADHAALQAATRRAQAAKELVPISAMFLLPAFVTPVGPARRFGTGQGTDGWSLTADGWLLCRADACCLDPETAPRRLSDAELHRQGSDTLGAE